MKTCSPRIHGRLIAVHQSRWHSVGSMDLRPETCFGGSFDGIRHLRCFAPGTRCQRLTQHDQGSRSRGGQGRCGKRRCGPVAPPVAPVAAHLLHVVNAHVGGDLLPTCGGRSRSAPASRCPDVRRPPPVPYRGRTAPPPGQCRYERLGPMSSTGTSWHNTLKFSRRDAGVRSRRSAPSSRWLLVQDAPVVVLDEPTTPLDPATARRVRAAPRTTLSRRTVLLVTHDPLAVADVDRVVTLEVGADPDGRPGGEDGRTTGGPRL